MVGQQKHKIEERCADARSCKYPRKVNDILIFALFILSYIFLSILMMSFLNQIIISKQDTSYLYTVYTLYSDVEMS